MSTRAECECVVHAMQGLCESDPETTGRLMASALSIRSFEVQCCRVSDGRREALQRSRSFACSMGSRQCISGRKRRALHDIHSPGRRRRTGRRNDASLILLATGSLRTLLTCTSSTHLRTSARTTVRSRMSCGTRQKQGRWRDSSVEMWRASYT